MSTINDFILKAIKKHGDFYDYSKVKITCMKDTIIIVCPKHGQFTQKASYHVAGCGCKICGKEKQLTFSNNKKKHVTKFIEESKNLFPNQYSYEKTNYINAITKVTIFCLKHQTNFEITPNNHIQQKRGCPTCGIENKNIPNKKTTEIFVKEAQAKWNNTYNYNKTTYINKNTYITYDCNKCNKKNINQKPRSHLKYGCPYCNHRGITKYTTETFLLKTKELYQNKYSYPNLNFQSMNDYIDILCNTCKNLFKQKANNHINLKNECPYCNGGIKLNPETYIEFIKNKNPNNNYTETIYTTSHNTISYNCPKHGQITQLAYIHKQANYSCPKCGNESQSSIGETELKDFIKLHYKKEIIENDRIQLDKKEIDIFLPEEKLGFEFHGNYWHRETQVGKNLHWQKANSAKDKNIKLIQIFEDEWNCKKNIVKSRILSLLNINQRIYARNTTVITLDKITKNKFLQENHIQGKCQSTINYGLISENILVACMTFGKARFKRKETWELYRYASMAGTNVIGGASKLLTTFKRNYQGSIVTYADRKWSEGNLYYKLGFVPDGITKPGYKYFSPSTHEIKSRMSCQKHKLINLPFYNEKLSEYEIMLLNGFDRIWDAGHYKFILRENNEYT